jgi:hypothetical protein
MESEEIEEKKDELKYNPHPPTPCHNCGWDMVDESGCLNVGVCITTDKTSSEGRRVSEMFGGEEFKICHCCWYKSMGLKPVN